MSDRDREMIAAIAAIETDDDDEPAVTIDPPRRPSQVYSIRIPVERVEQLRTLAASQGTAPTQLIRQWVIERLDETPLGSAPSRVFLVHKLTGPYEIEDVRKRLERVAS